MKKVLVIEDTESIKKALEIQLADDGYDVASAGNGKDGLEKAKTFLPDVVILDLLMPEMDGFQVLRSIKENQDLKEAKVIVLSNVGKKTDIEKAINLGAATYFTKSSLLLDELDRHIKDLLAETES